MSGPVNVFAIFPIKASKTTQVETTMNDMISYVEKNEPNTWTYQLNKQIGAEGDVVTYIVKETYKTMQDYTEVHVKSSKMQELLTAIGTEDVLAGEPKIVPCAPVSGFDHPHGR
ncbi:MAG: hypothetical protein M1828_001969 [Chrysothrix sp. TS-e1954]|nr:MAG: hypothetical protein M1828_001969 [Chrysothrix sp. TS-e1954]